MSTSPHKQTSQAGIAHLMILAGLVLVLVVGAAGYAVVRSQSGNDKKETTAQKTAERTNDESKKQASAAEDKKPEPKTEVSGCLPEEALKANWRYETGWDFYFEADSAKIRFPDAAALGFDQMKGFYTTNTSYDWKFSIQVSLYQANSSAKDTELANARAKTIEDSLISTGVPKDRIEQGDFISGGDPSNAEFAGGSRNAVVKIDTSCR